MEITRHGNDTARIASRRSIGAIMLFAAAGALSLGLAPFIVSALTVHAGLTAAEAGRCISAEMAGCVLGSAVIISLGQRVRTHAAVLVALLTIVVGNLACLAVNSYHGYIAWRFVAGFGCGLTTLAFALLASTQSATRNFAIYAVGATTLVAVCGEGVPLLSRFYGANALFVMIAGVSAIAAAIAWLIPLVGKASAVATAVRMHRRFPGGVIATLLGSAMTFFYFTPLGAFWAYLSEIGAARVGRSSQAFVATTIAAAFLIAGIAGSLLAALLAKRATPGAMAAICIAGTAITVGATTMISGPMTFAVGVPAFILFWFLGYPFFMGLLSEVDRSGQLAMVGSVIQMLGYVVGPLLAGPQIEQRELGAFSVMCLVGFACSLLCVLAMNSGKHIIHSSRVENSHGH